MSPTTELFQIFIRVCLGRAAKRATWVAIYAEKKTRLLQIGVLQAVSFSRQLPIFAEPVVLEHAAMLGR